MDVQITSVIVGVLLGGFISSLGFYFKNKKDVREKVNESLFHLLEVWSLMAAVKVTSSDKFHSMLIEKVKRKFPYENIGDNEKALLKEGLVKALPMLTGMAGGLSTKFLSKYKSSVDDLAKIYPLMAFDLNKNQMLTNFLDAVDNLVDGSDISDTDEIILSNMREFMLDESFNDLEEDLIKLSSRSGCNNKRKVRSHINKTRSKFDDIPDNIFDEYVNKVISPAIQAHYDKLGVENPNKAL